RTVAERRRGQGRSAAAEGLSVDAALEARAGLVRREGEGGGRVTRRPGGTGVDRGVWSAGVDHERAARRRGVDIARRVNRADIEGVRTVAERRRREGRSAGAEHLRVHPA